MRIERQTPVQRGLAVPEAGKRFLWEKINRRIRQKGKISYRELVNTLLYDRDHGFYTRYLQIGAGKEHHFSTRPIDLSPRYGQGLAKKILRFMHLFDLASDDCHLVALGDGNGILFGDILEALKDQPGLPPGLKKTSIEMVPRFAAEQEARLAKFGARVIKDNAVNLDRHFSFATGVFYAHELFDQFPASKVVNQGRGLAECYLASQGDALKEVIGPLSSPALEEYFKITEKMPRPGDPCVVCLDGMVLLQKFARSLKRGLLFIIDYNTQRPGLHKIKSSRFGKRTPLTAETAFKALGRDITTDVDFEALKLVARHFGLKVLFDISEFDFLGDLIPKPQQGSLGYPMHVLALAKE